MIDLFGQAPVRANLSARQAKALGLMTSGTSGPPSIISLESDALQQSLESKLRAKMQTLGSTLYALDMEALGYSFGAVPFPSAGVGAPHIRDRLYWVAHAANKRQHGRGQAKRAMGETRHGSNLNDFVMLAGWGAPTASEPGGTGDQYLARSQGKTGNTYPSMLTHRVAMAGWPTPNTMDVVDRKAIRPSRTATGRTSGYLTEDILHLKDNPQPARLTATGEMLTGSTAGMASGGQLRPGTFPLAHGAAARVGDACAPMATPSTPKRRGSSSKR